MATEGNTSATMDIPQSADMSELFRIPEKFTTLNRLITRDLNKAQRSSGIARYCKDDIARFLDAPSKNSKALRDAVTYIYGASSHFRRLIQYFVGLSDLAYVISPSRIDVKAVKEKSFAQKYRKVQNAMLAMNVRSQFPKILTVCLREDTFYGTLWVTNDNITIQQLPPDFCDISTIEGNVFNVSFNFSYFDTNSQFLDFYPPEFRLKYDIYRQDRQGMKWQELDSPNSFAIKCNADIPNYPMPPFAGVLREVYDLEDYKDLKLTKTTLENYAMLVMTLGVNDDGSWQMDLDKAKGFWQNLENVLPEEVGSILSPMPINKISFEKANTKDTDTISEAEQNLFTAAGVSSLIFNNPRASANALLLSIKADQAITYGIVKSIEDMVNRFIQAQSYGKNFKVTFLDCSPFNRKELGDAYLKACQYGIPMISYYAASQGMNQADLDCMSFLETKVLELDKMFKPLRSSATMSSKESQGATDEGGAPTKDVGDLTDSGEQTREDGDDW